MERAELIARLKSSAEAIRAEGATGLYLYGSRARGDHLPDSDLDIFVDYDPSSRFSALDLAGIYNINSDHTGLRVSITTRDSLHPKLKADIERQAIQVF